MISKINKILLSASIGLMLITSNSVYASNSGAPTTFTEENCDSLYLVKMGEKLMVVSGVALLVIADVAYYVALAYHLPTAFALIPLAGAILQFSYLAYGMANTPFRSEKTAYCAKMERKKQRMQQRQGQ